MPKCLRGLANEAEATHTAHPFYLISHHTLQLHKTPDQVKALLRYADWLYSAESVLQASLEPCTLQISSGSLQRPAVHVQQDATKYHYNQM